MTAKFEGNLSSNRRSIVMQPSLFMKATQLTRLNLHNTEFGCLTEPTFDGLVNLKSLNLSKSNLKGIHQLAFNRLVNLEELDLSQNPGIFFVGRSANWPPTLTKLSISQCNLKQLDANFFNGIHQLGEIRSER